MSPLGFFYFSIYYISLILYKSFREMNSHHFQEKKKIFKMDHNMHSQGQKNFARTQSSNLMIAENALGKKEVFPATFPGECHNNVNREALRIQIDVVSRLASILAAISLCKIIPQLGRMDSASGKT